MRTLILIAVLLASAPVAVVQMAPVQRSDGADRDRTCEPGSRQQRTTLYFGLTRPRGTVSDGEWADFLQREVTSRFPDGLTVWEADGQWRRPDGHIGRERSKVLLLVHEDTPTARADLRAVVTAYKEMFEQESVLWESAAVCAAF